VDKVYTGKIVKIVEFGAFVNIMPNQDGLLHISEIAHERVEKVEDHLKEGDEIDVKVLDLDRGRIKLSRKVLLDK
jgi:polyribonucleotide nucleotidyltransferase